MTGAEGAVSPPIFWEIVGFSEMLMHSSKNFILLLLVKMIVFNFIGKSLNLPPYPAIAMAPLAGNLIM